MNAPRRRSLRIGAVLAGLLALAFGATALAAVVVYKNNFAGKAGHRDVTFTGKGPKACERRWAKDKKRMAVTVKKAPKACHYGPPVRSTSPKPDHEFQVAGRITKKTRSSLRPNAYIAALVRVSENEHYELRAFAQGKRFELLRRPDGPGFPVQGTNEALKGAGGLNRLRLQAFGNRIRAWVNGAQVANVDDANSNQVQGKRLEFAVGNQGDSRRDTFGVIEQLKLSVPNP